MHKKNAETLKKFLAKSGIEMANLGLGQDPASYYRFESSGFIPLSMDILWRSNNVVRLALAHNVRHESGDNMADPDMEFELDLNDEKPLLFAKSYQNDFAGVYNTDSNAALARSMDDFANMWLNNLLEQGHKVGGDGES